MNIWNEDLMCFWLKIEPMDETTIGVYLPEGSACDMSGAIKIAKAVMPKVKNIVVFSGNEKDLVYAQTNSKWSVVY